jgi:tetratricopeptide (TPR) repeat protein
MFRIYRVIIFIAVIAGINYGLFIGAPSLFTVDKAKASYVEAHNLELTRVYSRAIPRYEMVKREFPNSKYTDLCDLGIANCSKALGDYQRALQIYDTLYKKYKDRTSKNELTERILAGMADTYRDKGDIDKATETYNLLVDGFPDSQMAKDARTYMASVAANIRVENSEDNPDVSGPTILQVTKLKAPSILAVGQSGKLLLEVRNTTDDTVFDVSVMTELVYWKGIKVAQIKPNPSAIQEFWGKRMWVYPEIPKNGNLTIEATVVGEKPGEYKSSLTFEANMEEWQINQSLATVVKE